MRQYSQITSILFHSRQILSALSHALLVGLLLFTSSCADHKTGYEDGYNNIEARNWLLLVRHQYDKGYMEGQMQAFHDDWYAENADDIDVGLNCPVTVMKLSPVLVTEQLGRIKL